MNMIKRQTKTFLLFIVLSLIGTGVQADGGLWLPQLLKGEKYKDMKKAGLKISPEEIYNINKACLKDAIISLSYEDGAHSSFATASFISGEGLVITNFHCVLSYLERLSNVNRDFIKYGYWSTKVSEETPLFNLQANQLLRMEDVTTELTANIDTIAPEKRDAEINKRCAKLVKKLDSGSHCSAKIYAMFGNTQYIAAIVRSFPDVRLVAAPPISIGKFGGDDDNWRWPRQTGDFALLRVYTNTKNMPAKYSKENVPYKTDFALSISSKGVKEGDFAMIYGYPGRTKQYIPSFSLEKIIFNDTKAKAEIAEAKLKIYREAMSLNDTLRIRYTPRVSSINNSYLRYKGEMNGVRESGLFEIKQKQEEAFQQWAESTPERKAKYGYLLQNMKSIYEHLTQYNYADVYFTDVALNGSSIIPFSGKFEKLMSMYRRKKVNQKAAEGEIKRLLPLVDDFFTQWDKETERKLFSTLLAQFKKNVPTKFFSSELDSVVKKYGDNMEQYSQDAFSHSIITNKDSLISFLKNISVANVEKMTNDPLYKISLGFYYIETEKIIREKGFLQGKNGELFSQYLQALYEMNKSKVFAPDANKTMRLSYGKVAGCEPEDGLKYNYFATLDGAISKHLQNQNNPDYYIPKKLQKLYDSKDFGKYAEKGVMHTCFMTNAQTTSGNSGSPVLNAKGELIGLNFDRIWQGISSDYSYNPEKSRSIAVDIRYVLFLLEKYSPSTYVLKEMKVH